MSRARDDFHRRISSLEMATGVRTLLDKPPTRRKHNARARILRNGLGVIAFAILEDFIKSRTAELTGRMCNRGVPFLDLPEGVRSASFSGALRAVIFQAELQKRQQVDPTALIQQHSAKISSTSGAGYSISGF